MTDEQRLKEDMLELVRLASFRRFLFRVIQTSGILSASTDGSQDRHLAYDEGRRNLGLDILAMVEKGQPVSHPEGLPILTLLQVLREEANQQPQEKSVAKPRYDRTAELDDADDERV